MCLPGGASYTPLSMFSVLSACIITSYRVNLNCVPFVSFWLFASSC